MYAGLFGGFIEISPILVPTTNHNAIIWSIIFPLQMKKPITLISVLFVSWLLSAQDWDACVVPEAEPGDYVAYNCGEKGKDRWFVGRTKVQEKRVFNLSFDFLREVKKYKAKIYADAANAHYKLSLKDIKKL